MKYPKCKTCGELHPYGPCPQFKSSRSQTDEAKARELPKVQGAARRQSPESKQQSGVGSERSRLREAKPIVRSVRSSHGLQAPQPTPREAASSGDPIPAAGVARKTGRPRIEDRDKTLKKLKPWVALGMSRSTWYSRQAEQRQKEKQ